MTKKETVLAMLTNAAHGVTGREFVEANVFRYSARIKELRDEGYEIESKRLSQGNFRFRLVGNTTDETASSGSSVPGQNRDSSEGIGQSSDDPLPLVFACDLSNSPYWELD